MDRSVDAMSAQPSQTSQASHTNGNPPAPAPKPTASETYSVPGIPSSAGATFGVNLGEQLQRDGREIPRVVEKCAQAIEAYGARSQSE